MLTYTWKPMRLGKVCGKLQTEALRFGRLQGLLSAAGVKIREGKQVAAVRTLMNTADHSFEHALGMSPAALAEQAEAAARIPGALQAIGEPQPVFDFILGPSSRGPVKSRENQTVRGRRRQT
ncbi:hypothetical protein [Mesorhizobium sp. L-2-11]|uniref:hypothetical protein n=1 Tax=Mesorhizobium sp. L-2-11 TaxID=2744521 RepID=UPI001FD1241E|nr:hypothetical protein [Mesorhizobium sp. L-2-11]